MCVCVVRSVRESVCMYVCACVCVHDAKRCSVVQSVRKREREREYMYECVYT